MLAPPWACPTTGTSDYFNSCAASSSPVDVPVNTMGTQSPESGNGYAGIVLRHESNQYREYLITQLTEPLAADMWYYVSFYVSPAETGCNCLLYTSDAADERSNVDFGGRRILKKKKKREQWSGSIII